VASHPKVPVEFLKAVAEHRNRLEKVLTKPSAARLKRIYDQANAEVNRRLSHLLKAQKGDTFTAHQQRIVLAQVRHGQMAAAQALAGQMGPLSHKAQEAALKGLINQVQRLHTHFTGAEIPLPIEEAATFQGVVEKGKRSLLREYANVEDATAQPRRKVWLRYGARVVGDVEQKLSVSLLAGTPTGEVIDDVADTISGEWWQGERIVRTEMNFAYNLAHRNGILEIADEVPEMMMQWVEHCLPNGMPLDDRVGTDSIAMHLQVAPAGGYFTMPAHAPFPGEDGKTAVYHKLVGRSWDFPPNRPNDRSTLSPWMKSWGVPGWRYEAGRRIWQ